MIRPESQWFRFGARGVVSLLHMMQVFSDLFVRQMYEMHDLEVRLSNPAQAGRTLDPSGTAAVYAHVSTFAITCRTLELNSTAKKCDRFTVDFQYRRPTLGEAHTFLREVRERFEDDLREHLFLELTESESDLYRHPLSEWTKVVERFSKIQFDIEEAAKCYALGRYGAAVFHVMLVAEFGVIKAAQFFEVEGDKPGWGCLEKLRRVNDKKWEDKSAKEQKHHKFLADLLPLAFAMKDSWRHKMDHIDNKLVWMDTNFSPELAGDIVKATAGFMRRLAEDLPN